MYDRDKRIRGCVPVDKILVLRTIKRSLSKMAFGDILRASEGNAKMGAFILASCFIDYLAGFYCGHKATREDYKNFVRTFLTDYDPDKLYHDLRCELVHNYSEGGSYAFTDMEKAGKHLSKLNDGRALINLGHFSTDIRNAMDKYFKLLETDQKIVNKSLIRYRKVGLLTIIRINSNSENN
jgi:hypothetical protein